MEAVGNLAKAPVQLVWDWISESVNKINSESSLIVKGWHLSVVLFLLCVLVLAITWFIVFKATQVALVITFGAFSIAMIFSGDG